ncbi:MAG TPA: drug/metabolite exporter YedA [Ktedonobacterales bacterium]|jgi:drug/metabolite transporter (DMT)-like permease|nr:drug/metabolite exporter YedA [Ktedonobacterales bacterium]
MASNSVRPTATTSSAKNVTLGVVIALGLVYVIWGSTYLGIRFADQTMPPLLMGGVRFLIAGTLLYLWCRARGIPTPSWREWRSTGVVGLCLLAGGNGTVIVVEQQVPSGIAALLVALVPLWIVVLQWLRRSSVRPTLRTLAGVGLGLVGVGLLATHGGGTGGQGVNPMALLLVLSSGIWAWGTLYAQRATLPSSPLMSTAVEMLVGGAALLLAGIVAREPAMLAGHTISVKSWLALGYLIIFGSIVAYTAYTWLLRKASPALVSTYAYVNPLVAVLLGWVFAGESVTHWTLISSAIIVSSVVLITLPRRASIARSLRTQGNAASSASGNASEEPRAAVEGSRAG